MKLWILAVFVLAVGCAMSDPYPPVEQSPIPESVTDEALVGAFNGRWPETFKSVQTVTIDFRVKTLTLTGYLVVQGRKFRLQGMNEQGIRLFEFAWDGETLHEYFIGDGIEAHVLHDVARDIQRIFTTRIAAANVHRDDEGATLKVVSGENEFRAILTGENARVVDYREIDNSRLMYRVRHYEYAEGLPTVVVLRDNGYASQGPKYILTVKIEEFTPRDEPYPDRVFAAPEDAK